MSTIWSFNAIHAKKYEMLLLLCMKTQCQKEKTGFLDKEENNMKFLDNLSKEWETKSTVIHEAYDLSLN
ncbi:hypothetical protein CR513_60799, partial [Mucuna pruriens]